MDARTIALICHANAYLSRHAVDPVRAAAPFPVEDWLADDDKFVFRLETSNSRGEPVWSEITRDPDLWFAYLAREGIHGLRFVRSDLQDGWRHEWKANGVSSGIEARRAADESDFWSIFSDIESPTPAPAAAGSLTSLSPDYWTRLLAPLVDVGRDPPPNEILATKMLRLVLSVPMLPFTVISLLRSLFAERAGHKRSPWHFVYSRVARGRPLSEPPQTLEEVRDELQSALVEARQFAQQHRDKFQIDYAERFNDSLAWLDHRDAAEKTARRINRPFAPEGTLAREAVAILEAARSAWVFGGMMSWNDFGLASNDPDHDAIQREYDAVTRRLYDSLVAAVSAAANSTFPRA